MRQYDDKIYAKYEKFTLQTIVKYLPLALVFKFRRDGVKMKAKDVLQLLRISRSTLTKYCKN